VRGLSGQLCSHMAGGGLEIDYQYSRKPSLYGPALNAITLTFTNRTTSFFSQLKLEDSKEIRGFEALSVAPSQSVDEKVHVNFQGRADAIKFTVMFAALAAAATDGSSAPAVPAPRKTAVKIVPAIGELLRPDPISHTEFETRQKRLSGMSETVLPIVRVTNIRLVAQQVVNAMNVAPLLLQPTKDTLFRFAAKVLSKEISVLIELDCKPDDNGNGASCRVTMNCDDMMFSGQLLDLLRASISK